MQRGATSKRLCAEMTLVRMCDEKLDDSNEALLLRISALEDRLASGAFVSAASDNTGKSQDVVQKSATKAEAGLKDTEAPKYSSKITPSDTSADDVPWSVPNNPSDAVKDQTALGKAETLSASKGEAYGEPEKTAVSDTASKTSKAGEAKESSAPKERKIDAWADVVSKVRKTDDGAASMLERAKATISDDGKVRIEFDNSFALMIADNDEIKKQIATALSLAGTDISYINIRMECSKNKEKSNSNDPLFDF